MARGYTETERTYILLSLERDCLRLTLAHGGPELDSISDPRLRADLGAEVQHARKRLPEIERLLWELDGVFCKSVQPGSHNLRGAILVDNSSEVMCAQGSSNRVAEVAE